VAKSRPRSSRRARWVALATGLGVVAAVAGIAAIMTVNGSSRSETRARSGAVQRIVATLAPSVVAVRAARGHETSQTPGGCAQAGAIGPSGGAPGGARAGAGRPAPGGTPPPAPGRPAPASRP